MIDQKAISAYRRGLISKEELDYYHNKQETKRKETQKKRKIITLSLALFLIFNLGIWMTLSILLGGTTGLVIGDEFHEVNLLFTEDGYYNINLTNITSIKVSGMLSNGNATITMDDGTIVYQDSTTNILTTNKESYALNEEIVIITQEPDYTLWLNNENGDKSPVGEPLIINEPGNYVLDAIFNISNNITKESISFIVRNDTNITNETRNYNKVFTEVCEETCNIPSTTKPLELTIQLSEGAELILNSVTLEFHNTNSPPIQAISIPNINLIDETTIDLNTYFVDSDGDQLSYEINNIIGIEESINNNLLTLNGVIPGTYEASIYVSDSKSLIQSNTFSITVPKIENNIIKNNTNSSNLKEEIINQELNNTNESLVTTTTNIINTTNISDNIENNINSCNNPDPNLRPQECFINNEQKYFDERFDFTIENKNRIAVGRFNSLGNLLIKGDIIEFSSSQPSKDNFVVGYSENFNFIPTAWIDDSGNFHIKGSLHEEEINLQIPTNSYSFQGLSGINLGYINPRTGDMYLRGNLIPYRRKI